MIHIDNLDDTLYHRRLYIPFTSIRPTLCRELLTAFRNDIKLVDDELEQWAMKKTIESLEQLLRDL